MRILSVNKDLNKIIFFDNGKKIIGDYFIRPKGKESVYVFSHKLPISKNNYYFGVIRTYNNPSNCYSVEIMQVNEYGKEIKVGTEHFKNYKAAKNFVLNEVLSKHFSHYETV